MGRGIGVAGGIVPGAVIWAIRGALCYFPESPWTPHHHRATLDVLITGGLRDTRVGSLTAPTRISETQYVRAARPTEKTSPYPGPEMRCRQRADGGPGSRCPLNRRSIRNAEIPLVYPEERAPQGPFSTSANVDSTGAAVDLHHGPRSHALILNGSTAQVGVLKQISPWLTGTIVDGE